MKWFALQAAGGVFAILPLLLFFEDAEGFAEEIRTINVI